MLVTPTVSLVPRLVCSVPDFVGHRNKGWIFLFVQTAYSLIGQKYFVQWYRHSYPSKSFSTVSIHAFHLFTFQLRRHCIAHLFSSKLPPPATSAASLYPTHVIRVFVPHSYATQVQAFSIQNLSISLNNNLLSCVHKLWASLLTSFLYVRRRVLCYSNDFCCFYRLSINFLSGVFRPP